MVRRFTAFVPYQAESDLEYLDYEAMSIRDPDDTMPGSSTGHHRSILSNRISHFLDIKGPR